MYEVGDKIKFSINTPDGLVSKEGRIVDKEIHPNGNIAYRLTNGMYIRPDQVDGKVHNSEYSKQKEKLKL